jgi:hypothetical protein
VPTPVGHRTVFVAKVGSIKGPNMAVEILPGRGDWLLIGSDGIGRVEAKVCYVPAYSGLNGDTAEKERMNTDA